MINPRALDAFRSIVTTGSTTRAAKALGMSQPAISRLLKSLEDELEFPLFERISGRLTATPEGLILFEEVQRHFSGLDHIGRVARQIRIQRMQRGRIAALPTIGLRFLPKVISTLGRTGERPVFSITIIQSRTVLDLLKSRQCDLGIVSEVADETDIRIIKKFSLDCMVILPPDHPWKNATTIAWSDLEGQPFVMMDDSSIVGQRVSAAFTQSNIAPTVAMEAELTAPISAAVMYGLGTSVVDAFTALDHAERGGVVIPLAEPVQFGFKIARPISTSTTRLQDRFVASFSDEVIALMHALSPEHL